MDHVSAVTYVDYAPTGREFVSGSYDKTIRYVIKQLFVLTTFILIYLGLLMFSIFVFIK